MINSLVRTVINSLLVLMHPSRVSSSAVLFKNASSSESCEMLLQIDGSKPIQIISIYIISLGDVHQ